MSESTAANSSSLTQSPAWKALQAHYQTLHTRHLRQLFDEDPGRGERFSVATGIPDWLVALSGRGNHHPHGGWTMGQGGR